VLWRGPSSAWTINPLKVLYVHYQSEGSSRPPRSASAGGKRAAPRPAAGAARQPLVPDRHPHCRGPTWGTSREPSGADWEQAEMDNLWTSRWGAPLPASCRSRFAVGVQTLQGHFLVSCV